VYTWTLEGGAYVLRDAEGAAVGRVRRGNRNGRWYAGWLGEGRTGSDHWLECTPFWSASTARTEVVKRLGIAPKRVNPARV
jgi:hypothetical protein